MTEQARNDTWRDRFIDFAGDAVRWARNADLVALVALLIVVGGTWGFVELLDEVHEGDAASFDRAAIELVGGYAAPRWLEEIGRDITALGGIFVLSVFTLATAGYLLMVRKYHALLLLLAATGGALLLSLLLKDVIDRPRPDIIAHRSHVMTKSFPSGHAMLSAAVYLTLGVLLARLTTSLRLKLYFLSIALLLTLLVGVSRVFMGVHWPTDVMAGWAAGLAWAIGCWLVARWLQRRGSVEPPQPPTDPAAAPASAVDAPTAAPTVAPTAAPSARSPR